MKLSWRKVLGVAIVSGTTQYLAAAATHATLETTISSVVVQVLFAVGAFLLDPKTANRYGNERQIK